MMPECTPSGRNSTQRRVSAVTAALKIRMGVVAGLSILPPLFMFVFSRSLVLAFACLILSLMGAGVALSRDQFYQEWSPSGRVQTATKRVIDFCHALRYRWAHRIVVGAMGVVLLAVVALALGSAVWN